jgi:2-polyprenyl-3-methyl-5-hydroxy-6-metoxy-1,4-benzoquinol methylase
MFRFICNICNAQCQTESSVDIPREEPSCEVCGSTVRFRWIVHALSTELFGRSLPLGGFPQAKHIKGIGMSDWLTTAEVLHNQLDYENTFYHQEPRLDIADTSFGQAATYDFIVASEIFEHIPQPIQPAFDNLSRLLKPNGFAIFSTPWVPDGHTREHYPELHDWSVVQLKSGHVLVNRTRNGQLQTFEDLVFHGGPGTTLEFRLFSRSDLTSHLEQAGFEEIEFVERETNLQHGITWAPWSRGIVLRKSRKQKK